MHAEDAVPKPAPPPPLTAGQLIRELERHNPELPVRFAGPEGGASRPVASVHAAPDARPGSIELRP